jgi:hypothetical protein
MTTADLTRAPGEQTVARRPSTVETAGWLLRAAALTAFVGGFAAAIVQPGVRGNASEQVVVWVDRLTATLAYFLLLLLMPLLVWGSVELGRMRGNAPAVTRVVVIVMASAVAMLSGLAVRALAFHEQLPPTSGLALVATAAVAAIVAAYGAVLRPHTRAAAALLLVLAFAGVARLGAWELATRANEHADLALFHWSRGLATAGVLFEAMGQLIAVTWLGTRSRLAGQLGSTLALLVAFALTWGVAKGVHSGAQPWQYVMHTALADAPGLPPPYGLDAVATFLVPASLLLALVAAAQPNQVTAVVAAVALALVSHGAFDAPLRALCMVVAATWLTVASEDDASMWHALIGHRTGSQRAKQFVGPHEPAGQEPQEELPSSSDDSVPTSPAAGD